MTEEEKVLAPEEVTPAEEPAVEETPVEEAPVEETPVEEAPDEEAPVEEVSTEEAPAEEAPAEEAHAAVAPVEEVPTPAPAEEKPAPVKKAKKKKSGKPHALLRFLLQIISLALALVLIVGVTATALIADVRLLTSKDGVKQIIGTLFERPTVLRPGMGAAGVGTTGAGGGNTSTADLLIDYVLDTLEQQYGDQVPVTRDQVEVFLEESTIKEFVADKIASYTEDIFTGELDTMITVEEVLDLIEENKPLVQEHFGVEITDEMVQTVTGYMEEVDINKVIHEEVLAPLVGGGNGGGSGNGGTGSENGGEGSGSLGGILGGILGGNGSGSNSSGGALGGMLGGGGGATVVIPGLDQIEENLPPIPAIKDLPIISTLPGMDELPELPTASDFAEGVPVNVLLNILRAYTSEAVLNVAMGLCVALMVLLLLCNFYNIPGGLRWCAFPCIFIGGLLSIPTYVCLNSPDLLDSLFSQIPMVADAITAVVLLVSEVHYGILFQGVGIFGLSLVALIIRAIIRAIRKGREEALEFA